MQEDIDEEEGPPSVNVEHDLPPPDALAAQTTKQSKSFLSHFRTKRSSPTSTKTSSNSNSTEQQQQQQQQLQQQGGTSAASSANDENESVTSVTSSRPSSGSLWEQLQYVNENATTLQEWRDAELMFSHHFPAKEVRDELCEGSWTCGLSGASSSLPIPGRLFVTKSLLCFHGQLLFTIETIILPLTSLWRMKFSSMGSIRLEVVLDGVKKDLVLGQLLKKHDTLREILVRWRECACVIARSSRHWFQIQSGPNLSNNLGAQIELEKLLRPRKTDAAEKSVISSNDDTDSTEMTLEMRKVAAAAMVQLLKNVMGKRHWSNTPIDVGSFLILRNKQRKRMAKLGGAAVDDPDMAATVLAMRHARAAYGLAALHDHMRSLSGWILLQTVNRNVITATEENIPAIQLLTGLERENIIHFDYSMKLFQPCHYIAIDHNRKWIILCVRGTLDEGDLIADACAESIDVHGGRAHQGIASSAKAIIEATRPILQTALQTHRGYSIMTTGHSLGAGCAALIAYLLREDPAFRLDISWEVDIRAIVFGCPSIVSVEVSERCRGFVTSVVCGKDVIPRTSLASLHKLVGDLSQESTITRITRTAELAWSWVGAGKSTAATGTGAAETTIAAISEAPTTEAATAATAEACTKANVVDPISPNEAPEKSVPPGRVLLILKPLGNQVRLIEADCRNFMEILVRGTALHHHLPDVYLNALEKLERKGAEASTTLAEAAPSVAVEKDGKGQDACHLQ